MAKAEGLSEKRRERRMKAILEAALEVFSERGYPKATMEEIAERALLTRQGLYKYFSDKQEILRALLEWKIEELITDIERAAAGGEAFVERVRRIVRDALLFQQKNRGVFHALITASVVPELVRDRRLIDLKSRLIQQVAAVIEEGMQKGEVRPAPAGELAELLLSFVFRAVAKDYLEPDNPANYDPRWVEEVFLYGVVRGA